MMIPPPKAERVAPSRIAEVAAFLRAARKLEAWKARHPDAARELAELAQVYNPSLTAAAAAVKAQGVSSGPFDLYMYSRKFDAAPLYKAVGRQRFASMGGVLDETPKLSIDKDRFVALVAQETVPEKLAAEVVSYTPNFHAPDPILLPAG